MLPTSGPCVVIEVKLQIYPTSGIVLKPNVHKCTSQELFQKVSTKQNAVTQASLALLTSEEHRNGASLLAGEAGAADVPTLQVSTHTEVSLQSHTDRAHPSGVILTLQRGH